MKKALFLIPALLALLSASPALADHHEEAAPKAEVVERDAEGRATKIILDGQIYDVCTTEGQDGCINPREAGLDFGNVPIDHWPDEPEAETKPDQTSA